MDIIGRSYMLITSVSKRLKTMLIRLQIKNTRMVYIKNINPQYKEV